MATTQIDNSTLVATKPMTFEERREKVRRSIQELAYSVECLDRQIKRDPNWQQWWPKTPEFESTSPNHSEARQ